MANANPPGPPSLDSIIASGWHLRLEDSFALVSITFLVYDHLLTFGDEIQLIWKRKLSPLSILFLINRYFAPIAFVICMVALFLSKWTLDVCYRFAKFEGIVTLVTVMVAEAMLILRVYAVYYRNKLIAGGLGILWIAQLALMSFILANSGPVIIPPSTITHGCILVANPSIGHLLVLWTAPTLVLDTAIISLLLFSLVRRSKYNERSSLYDLILTDGILYFAVVFASNLAWTVTGLVLPTDLANILSFYSTAITNVLIGRLTLNLRRHESTVYEHDVNSWGRAHKLPSTIPSGGQV